MGGITLNTWVAALFYEPVENHLKRVPKGYHEIDAVDDSNDIIDEEDEGITLEFNNQSLNETENLKSKPVPFVTLDENSPNTKSRLLSQDIVKHRTNGEFARSASAVVVQNCKISNEENIHRQRKISTPVKKNDSFVNQLNSSSSLYAVPESRLSHSSRLNRLNHRSRPPKRSPSTSSFQYVSTPYHGVPYLSSRRNSHLICLLNQLRVQ